MNGKYLSMLNVVTHSLNIIHKIIIKSSLISLVNQVKQETDQFTENPFIYENQSTLIELI